MSLIDVYAMDAEELWNQCSSDISDALSIKMFEIVEPLNRKQVQVGRKEVIEERKKRCSALLEEASDDENHKCIILNYLESKLIRKEFNLAFEADHPDLYHTMKEKGISLDKAEDKVRKLSGPDGYHFPNDVYDYMYKVLKEEEDDSDGC